MSLIRWFDESLTNNTATDEPDLLDILFELRTKLERYDERIEKLTQENIWSQQFTCPLCGPVSYAMITTKKTCLNCDSSLIRDKHPRLKELEEENENFRVVLKEIYILAEDPKAARLYLMEQIRDKVCKTLERKEGAQI